MWAHGFAVICAMCSSHDMPAPCSVTIRPGSDLSGVGLRVGVAGCTAYDLHAAVDLAAEGAGVDVVWADSLQGDVGFGEWPAVFRRPCSVLSPCRSRRRSVGRGTMACLFDFVAGGGDLEADLADGERRERGDAGRALLRRPSGRIRSWRR